MRIIPKPSQVVKPKGKPGWPPTEDPHLIAARENGINDNTYWTRVNDLGWSREEAATVATGARCNSRWEGVDTSSKVAKRYGIASGTLHSWKHRHPDQRHLSFDEIARIIVGNRGKRHG